MVKKIDDFVLLLAAAGILLVIFYLLSPVFMGPIMPGSVKPIEEFTLGSVGYVEAIPAKTLVLGNLRIGQTQTNVLRSFPKLTLTTSVTGGDVHKYDVEVPAWYRDTMDKVVVSFDVADTNMFGDLVVKWNGKVFYQDAAYPRAYRVEIGPEYVEEHNTLEVQAGGPGMRFWASTVYDLRDFEVSLLYGPAKLFPFELFSNELQAFKSGQVDFYGSGVGELTMKVNGQEIYRGVPAGAQEVLFTFAQVPLSVGDNILSLESKYGTVDMFNTELKIHLLTNQIVRTREFNLTGSDWSLVAQGARKGSVSYTVEEINREGSLTIALNGKQLSVAQVAEGINTAYFTKDQAREGENTIEFSGTGSFDISDVVIELVAA